MRERARALRLRLNAVIGVELSALSAREKWVCAAGGFAGIALVMLVCREMLHLDGCVMLVASMGASSVLLFGAPHGALSQPWPVLAGHTLSALVGVLCAKLIPDVTLAGACAVGVSIGMMHQFRCLHPPGGATALTAVIGGPAVRALGFSFVWEPVLINALILVGVAVVFNSPFAWRRYPAWWARRSDPPSARTPIPHDEVVAALRSLDSFVDVTEDDLVRLVRILSDGKK